jgi:hypothetical protein
MLIPPLAGLEILQYITAVKIFACLDLEQNFSFLDGHWIVLTVLCGKKESAAYVIPAVAKRRAETHEQLKNFG